MKFSWATRTDIGRVRDHNEDAVLPEPGSSEGHENLVAAIADGMGGHAGGEIASTTAIETVASVAGDATIRVQAANLAVLDAAALRPRLSGMGTTLTVGVFDPDGALDVGHVGDSRAYLLRSGELAQITSDHSFVGEMIATGQMTPEEAEFHPYRSVLTRAVGLEPTVEIESHKVELESGDRVLLCSDGVTAMVDDQALAALLVAEADPGKAADSIVAAANEAGGADNITVVLVDVA
jgi:serine/threonine protein phosphatase PrpC